MKTIFVTFKPFSAFQDVMFGRKKNDIFIQVHVSHLSTPVPEVFLEIFLPERERERAGKWRQ